MTLEDGLQLPSVGIPNKERAILRSTGHIVAIRGETGFYEIGVYVEVFSLEGSHNLIGP